MSQPAPDFSALFRPGTPAGAARFTGFPKYNFIGGHNDPTRIPVEALAEAAATALRREGSLLALYNLGHGPLGHRGMRDLVVQKLSRHRGIACSADDVLLTSGSLQGLDLVNALLVGPGDTVLIEELSYGGSISRVKALGARAVPMPLDAEGIRIDALANILDDLKARGVVPKYIYTIPTIQNPTGSILPLERREALLKLARAHGVPVFEDECYADLVWAGIEAPPALYAMDPDQVIHIGSFSKTLAPALRSAYAVAQWPVLSRLVALKQDAGSAAVEQMLVAEYFSRHFESHVGALSAVLKEKLDTMVEAVERLGDPYRLVLIGAGKDIKASSQVACVDFERAPERLAAVIASCDAFLHANENEIFGLVVLEAWAAGLPVVGPNKGGVGELLDNAVGQLSHGVDPASLAEAVEALFDRDIGALKLAARHRAETRHSWDHTFEGLTNLYATLLKGAYAPMRLSA